MQTPIKTWLSSLLTGVTQKIALSRNIALPDEFHARIEYPPNLEFGHYASPLALELARHFRKKPAEIAAEVLKVLEDEPEVGKYISKICVEGPGFLNFFISGELHQLFLKENFAGLKEIAGLCVAPGKKNRVLFEFVSANPTGPLNIVSARAAAVGDGICRVLERAGHEVEREYYVNDYGNQVRLLGISFAVRYLQKNRFNIELPENAYQGEYISDVLEVLLAEGVNPELPAADLEGEKLQEKLEELGEIFAPLAIEKLRSTHEKDLLAFGVKYNRFFSEKTLHDGGKVDEVFNRLKEGGHIYEQEGAHLFASTNFTDDKDRVVIRSDLRPTYLMADIAYHAGKIDRGFNRIYNIWGPDHHGYIARLAGAVAALGFGDPPAKKGGKPASGPGASDERFEVLIVQQVNMIEEGKPVVMSKRLGKFHTMVDLMEKVPVDVVRYFFLMRSQSSHLDFDLDLATSHSNKNPVYYIQYAGARICSIFREAGVKIDDPPSEQDISGFLGRAKRDDLLVTLWRYPEVVLDISSNLEVHLLCEYLHQLAGVFTNFYHEKENRVLDALQENPAEGRFLLDLCRAVRLVLEDGLSLLGIQAPETM